MKLKRSHDGLIFMTGIPILVEKSLYGNRPPLFWQTPHFILACNSVPEVVVVVFYRMLTPQCPYRQRCNYRSAAPAPSRGDYGKYDMHSNQ